MNAQREFIIIATITDESLGTRGVLGAFLKSHISNTSSHPTNIVGRVYPEFFSSFNIV